MATRPDVTVRVDIEDMAPGAVRHFRFEREDQRLGGFVVRHGDGLFAYVNRCPHVTYSLDIGDGNVQDPTRQFLKCSSHGAMFLPESGECFMGPVIGRRLESLPVAREGDQLVITITDEPPGWPRSSYA